MEQLNELLKLFESLNSRNNTLWSYRGSIEPDVENSVGIGAQVKVRTSNTVQLGNSAVDRLSVGDWIRIQSPNPRILEIGDQDLSRIRFGNLIEINRQTCQVCQRESVIGIEFTDEGNRYNICLLCIFNGSIKSYAELRLGSRPDLG